MFRKGIENVIAEIHELIDKLQFLPNTAKIIHKALNKFRLSITYSTVAILKKQTKVEIIADSFYSKLINYKT